MSAAIYSHDMGSLFISHSSRDRVLVDELRSQMAAAGFDAVFLDYHPDHGIPPGRNWERELYSALTALNSPPSMFLGSAAACG